ncbi:MAG: hypothetical protein KGL53_04550 [Elusimicrobia bacterium]|nr:hypothetical protein [Elusimicrobiota bacterium]
MMKRLTVRQYQLALKYRNGRYVETLGPGRYWVWSWLGEEAVLVDARLTSATVPGQEVLTKDGLPVRLTLAARYRWADPAKAVHGARDPAALLYEDVQLALRALVAERTLEELTLGKAALDAPLTEAVRPKAAGYGLELVQAGVKDVVLPGPVRALALKVEEERAAAKAKLAAAREELAAARVRANTAKLMAESPALQRLAELDALRELAGKPGTSVTLKVKP